ncbi:DUF4371 domain-containing protein [Cephalotus follicularis]|uniref:DUF4371 domain-containing protein n=1 Tax=Cephalotus follicularis TaxID=3775 RepID=A0A1Q3CX85_CEPFO|nr:DUF4371 domain-containing protein [Cephalotus follicularis]
MTIVLRFVDKEGIVQERFFDLVLLADTSILTLKNEISSILSRHDLGIHNLRGKGYDKTSNIRDKFSGLQALFLKDYPYAYYVHCFVHHLQLALIGASRDVISIEIFFTNLSFIINVVDTSSKSHDEIEHHHIDIPNITVRYIASRGRCPSQDHHVDVEHHYRIDVFTVIIDSQIQELNIRFSENAIELLVLCSVLDPRDCCKFFEVDGIRKIAHKYYPD